MNESAPSTMKTGSCNFNLTFPPAQGPPPPRQKYTKGWVLG